ncbi:right-handed parallel beta-helix repeat-containing protein [Candidatus Oscillochloris fontis]|uniref:right-handed parallel beta-helix repeat-containing protein n=1 Tax=Candidatus Oscillochloris fontis TaxID=2496868 RepID=UPI00101B7A53|nr:right-handed parallel beta-helix repeat-containing protein [Candidatus Oscillochloris fontis]
MKTSSIMLGLLTLLLLICVQPTAAMPLQAECEISGVITKDTTWGPESCDPYLVTGNIRINPGATLTILPGATVRFDSYIQLEVAGTLIARGTPDAVITFTVLKSDTPVLWSGILFQDSSTDAKFDQQANYISGSILQYIIIEKAIQNAVRIEQSTPYIDHATFQNSNPNPGTILVVKSQDGLFQITNSIFQNNGGTLSVQDCDERFVQPGILSVEAESAAIVNNQFLQNCASNIISLTSRNESIVSNNSIINNRSIALINVESPINSVIVSGNILSNNRSYIGLLGEGNVAFHMNTIEKNTLFEGIYDQPEFYALFAEETGGDLSTPVDAKDNYWGVTKSSDIEKIIYRGLC